MIQTTNIQTPVHRFAVVGGDGRMTHLAQRLTEEGCSVSLLGCGGDCLPPHDGPGELRICTTLQKAVENATALILPLPATRDGQTVHCPRDPTCTVTLEDVSEQLARTKEEQDFSCVLLGNGEQSDHTAAEEIDSAVIPLGVLKSPTGREFSAAQIFDLKQRSQIFQFRVTHSMKKGNLPQHHRCGAQLSHVLTSQRFFLHYIMNCDRRHARGRKSFFIRKRYG